MVSESDNLNLLCIALNEQLHLMSDSLHHADEERARLEGRFTFQNLLTQSCYYHYIRPLNSGKMPFLASLQIKSVAHGALSKAATAYCSCEYQGGQRESSTDTDICISHTGPGDRVIGQPLQLPR